MKNGASEGELALKHEERYAIVALDAGTEAIADPAVRRWLGRARFQRRERAELLPCILAALSLPPPDGGLAALRWWGQAGEPQGWLAAADPVYLETRMNHLRLRAFPEGEVPAGELREIFALLQERLGESAAQTFTACDDATGYLHLPGAIATAAVSPAVADGASPDMFLPEGPDAAGHDRWHSEVQMCLYDAAVNQRRMRAGRLPVNALWFWGGGTAPASTRRALPPLFASDALVRGYWRSSLAQSDAWPGSVGACIDTAGGGFVAVVPPATELPPLLGELSGLLARGSVRRLTLLFSDGVSAELRRGDRFRFWRRPADPAAGGSGT